MRKTHKIKTSNIEDVVMTKIKSDQIVMKPKWFFVVGSSLMIVGLVSLGMLTIFLTNLTIFLLRQHGPNSQWRLQLILESLPLWVPILAVLGICLGLWLLKKYDFSYKKNFRLIALVFIVSITLIAFLLDYTGLDNIWMKRGPMLRFYKQNLDQENITPLYDGRVKGIYKNGQGSGYGRLRY